MNVTFYDTKEVEIHEDLTEFDTVRLELAILPFAWYNISEKLQNSSFVLSKDGEDVTITVPDGLYTIETFNIAVQDALRGAKVRRAIEFKYSKNDGKGIIRLNKAYKPTLPAELKKMLGFVSKEVPNEQGQMISGDKPSIFFRHDSYNIYCNIIDSSKNLVNGQRSQYLGTFAPKIGTYGVTEAFKSNNIFAIDKYNHSLIKIEITDENHEAIDFQMPFLVTLKLE